MGNALTDGFGRRIDYLRVSVTDRCNYRCFYCMPEQGALCAGRSELLSAEELARLTALFIHLGVQRVRLTGGEPLVRSDLEQLVRQLRREEGLRDLSLSTNGHLLAERAGALKAAGLDRVNVSLDSLDPATFARITGHDSLARVLAGIDAALAVGFGPVKVNTVVMRHINDGEIGRLLDYAIEKGLELRFIETMPVGSAGAQAGDRLVCADEILLGVKRHCGAELLPVKGGRGAGPARYYQLGAGPARVGVISALSQHFCDGCNRVRLTATGDLVLCIDDAGSTPLGAMLRAGADDGELRRAILDAVAHKPQQHDFLGVREVALRPMSMLGG
jgi:cyclic pyranopterin phosphate synthase